MNFCSVLLFFVSFFHARGVWVGGGRVRGPLLLRRARCRHGCARRSGVSRALHGGHSLVPSPANLTLSFSRIPIFSLVPHRVPDLPAEGAPFDPGYVPGPHTRTLLREVTVRPSPLRVAAAALQLLEYYF